MCKLPYCFAKLSNREAKSFPFRIEAKSETKRKCDTLPVRTFKREQTAERKGHLLRQCRPTMLFSVFRIRVFFFPDPDQPFFLSVDPDRPKIRIRSGKIRKNPDPDP